VRARIMPNDLRSLRADMAPYWGPAALLLFAVVVAVVRFPFDPPIAEPALVSSRATDPAPVRRPQLQPMYQVGVFTYRCSDCHRIIPSPLETDRTLTQHREVRLSHGINTRCFNCHHRGNRDAFVDDYGNEIRWDQPQLLCAKCHGPVYRDWQNGAHGRTNGSWDPKRGVQTRLRCIECHDPHRPPFAPIAPAPAPHTLRAGRQDFGPQHPERDPLRSSRSRQEPASAPATQEQE